ncbi:MAG: hypothetical protein QM802_25650 [Agriterribacter sp.]
MKSKDIAQILDKSNFTRRIYLVHSKVVKQIQFTIICIFIATISYAKCAGNGIYLLSDNTALNKNGLIILEFYAYSRLLIPDLNKKYPVYIKSSKSKIPMVIAEILTGEFNVSQVVLKAASAPVENERYLLIIDNLPAYERVPQKYNEQTQKMENLEFTFSGITDTALPVLTAQVTEAGKTFVRYGCGPEKYVYFNISGSDGSELFARASVKNKLSGKTTEYILPIENGQIKIGHGMCAGFIDFDKGTNYEASIALMDQSGNKSEETQTIAFSCPYKETEEELMGK